MLMFTSIYYAAWTMGALETAFFAMLTLLANYILLGNIASGDALAGKHTERSDMKSRTKGLLLAGFIFFLVAITRADGFIIFLSAFICLLIFTALKKVHWKSLLIFTLSFLIPSMVVLLWRVWYYGDIFPNTYYNKAGLSIIHLYWGWIDVKEAFLGFNLHGNMYGLFGTPIPFILMFVPLFFKKSWSNPRIMLIAFQTGGYLVYIVYKGLDWMGMFRFFMHVFPLFVLMSGLGFAVMYDRLVKRERKTSQYARKITSLFLIFIILGSFFGMRQHLVLRTGVLYSGFGKWPPSLMLDNCHRDMGVWLRDQLRPGDLVAIGDAGIIPYFSGATILDMMGLIDKHISRVEAGQYYDKFDADYVFSHDPDWLLLMGYIVEDGTRFKNISFIVPYGVEVFKHPAFTTHYRLAHQEKILLMYKRLEENELAPPEWEVHYDPAG